MASAGVIEQGEMTGDIAVIVAQTAAMVLQDEKEFASLFAKVKAETEKLVADTSTKKGRDEIRSMAAKVIRTRTTIDKARLGLTADWRDRTNKVNAQNKVIEAQLDALADEVRKPLTDWEAAEKDRNDRADAIINQLARDAMVSLDETAADVRARGFAVHEMTLDPALFGDKLDTAQKAKDHAVDTLKAALARLTREEADRAELQRLRDEAAARELADQIAAEQAEAERQQALQIEAERAATERAAQEAAEHAQREQERQIAAQQAEAARIEQARLEAAALAEQQAREAAKAEQDKRDREHAEALAVERRKLEQIQRDEAQRQAAIRAEQEERQRLAADEAHRASVKAKAIAAMVGIGIAERTAARLVQAICANDIPHVQMEF